MEIEQFYSLFCDIFNKNPAVSMPSQEAMEQFYNLTTHMLAVNEHMNLTAITQIDDVIAKHYVDSLTISSLIPHGASVIDVGCGAGFPSLPLAILRPDVHITAIDSTAKRIRYVCETADLLGLSNLQALTMRAEEGAKKADFRERFDIATARAVAALPILSELCMPYVKKNGKFIAMKAALGEEEANDSAKAIRICGGDKPEILDLELTLHDGSVEPRKLVCIRKTLPTPAKYPRNYSQISKKPL